MKRVILFKKFLPLFLLPEKCQIILLSNIPPSKAPTGNRFNNPKNRFKIDTLVMIFIKICSFDSPK